MPIVELVAGVKSFGFTAIKSVISLITDNFNRTTSGSLGLGSSGIPWTAVKGTWYANGTQAQSDDAATNYSIATVQAGSENITASASVSGGTGVAFWVSDAGSWWASVPFYDTYTYTIPAGTYPSCTCGSYSYTAPAGTPPNNCNCGSYVSTPSAGTYPNCNCGSYSCTQQDPGTPASGCVCGGSYTTTYTDYTGFDSSTCAAAGGQYIGGPTFICRFSTTTYSCNTCPLVCTCNPCSPTTYCYGCGTQYYCNNCGTATGYNYYLRLLNSSGGTVSTATGDISIGSAAAAVKVTTSGNSITAQAYSDVGLTSTLGSALTYTATSPTRTVNHGIIKAPSNYSQGSTVDSFSANI